MIDDQSEAGAWADAIAHSHCMVVTEYRGADDDAGFHVSLSRWA